MLVIGYWLISQCKCGRRRSGRCMPMRRMSSSRVLSIALVDYAGFESIIDCLPTGSLAYFKELHIRDLSEDAFVLKDEFMRALRANGSLEYVEVERTTDGLRNSLFTNEDSAGVRGYCERNKKLPALLTKPQLNDKEDENEENETQAPIALYPPGFTMPWNWIRFDLFGSCSHEQCTWFAA